MLKKCYLSDVICDDCEYKKLCNMILLLKTKEGDKTCQK